MFLSAWDDGKIRVIGFKKEKDGSAKLFEKYTVRDTHNKGVTAIAITTCGTRLVTGGGEGQVSRQVFNLETVNDTKLK